MESTDSSERSSSTVMPENAVNLKEQLADLSEDKLYEYFSQTAWNMQEIVETFEVLKEKLGLSKKVGLDLYRGLKMTLGSSNSKVWKARDMMNLLEKRANQKEYMQQVGVAVWLEGVGGARWVWRFSCEGRGPDGCVASLLAGQMGGGVASGGEHVIGSKQVGVASGGEHYT